MVNVSSGGPLGYSVRSDGDDPFVKLARLLRALKDMQRRVDQHTHWGAYRDA